MLTSLLINLLFLNAQSEDPNMIHLNIIEKSSGNQNQPGYNIGTKIDKNTSGKVILMENKTKNHENWKDKGVLGSSDFKSCWQSVIVPS